jgi:type IV pilus assembly protein PilA
MFKRLGQKLKDQKGFTLIELLAVIVILGIIAAIAVPTITGVINKSKDDAKIAEALQILDAARLAHTEDATKVVWVYDGTAEPLSAYISKLEDKTFTVNYDVATNKFTITNHAATTTTEGAAKATGTTDKVLKEDDLAALAR